MKWCADMLATSEYPSGEFWQNHHFFQWWVNSHHCSPVVEFFFVFFCWVWSKWLDDWKILNTNHTKLWSILVTKILSMIQKLHDTLGHMFWVWFKINGPIQYDHTLPMFQESDPHMDDWKDMNKLVVILKTPSFGAAIAYMVITFFLSGRWQTSQKGNTKPVVVGANSAWK